MLAMPMLTGGSPIFSVPSASSENVGVVIVSR
jgi:hypothetical protein